MPIIGVSDNQTRNETPPSYPVWAKVKKGDEKPKKGPGRNLDYFRFEWLDDNAERVFNQLFKDRDKIQSVFIKTLAADVDTVFDSYYRKYTGNHVLDRKCDGCQIIRALNRDLVGQDCICDPEKRANKDSKSCQPSGYLYFTIQEMVDATGYVGQFILRTGSEIEIQNIASVLQAQYNKIGTLNDHPFLLQRTERKYDHTSDDGKPVQFTQWDVELVPPSDKILLDLHGVAQPKHLNLLSVHIPQLSQTPQLEAPQIIEADTTDGNESTGNESTAYESNAYETYAANVTELIQRYIGESDVERFIDVYSEGTFQTMEALYQAVPDFEQLKNGIGQFVVEKEVTVRVYGVVTQKWRDRVRYGINLGFTKMHFYSRESSFSPTLLPRVLESDMNTIGAHAFTEIFAGDPDFVTASVGLSDKGEYQLVKFFHPLEDIPF